MIRKALELAMIVAVCLFVFGRLHSALLLWPWAGPASLLIGHPVSGPNQRLPGMYGCDSSERAPSGAANPVGSETPDPAVFEYRGRRYYPTPRQWVSTPAVAQLSPDGRQLILLTRDSQLAWAEIYDVQGRRIAASKLSLSPDIRVYWVDEHKIAYNTRGRWTTCLTPPTLIEPSAATRTRIDWKGALVRVEGANVMVGFEAPEAGQYQFTAALAMVLPGPWAPRLSEFPATSATVTKSLPAGHAELSLELPRLLKRVPFPEAGIYLSQAEVRSPHGTVVELGERYHLPWLELR